MPIRVRTGKRAVRHLNDGMTSTLTPDIAYDYGLVPRAPLLLEQGIDGEGVLRLQYGYDDKNGSDDGDDNNDVTTARLHAWCRLVTQKGVWSPGGVYDPAANIPVQKPSLRTCVLFGVPAMAATLQTFESTQLCDEAVVKTRGFLDPSKTFLHTLHEAWVLAGIEVAYARRDVCTSTLFERAMVRCAVAICLQQRVAHVTRYAQWIGINVPVPGAIATIDYLHMTRDGLLHATFMWMRGSAITTGRHDVLAGLVVLSRLQATTTVSSLRVLYPLRNESVVLDTSAWCPDGLQAVLRIGMRTWHPDDHVAFVYCTGVAANVYDSTATVAVHTTDDLWDVVAGRRVVAWRYVDFAGNDRRFDDDVFDLFQDNACSPTPTSAEMVRALYCNGNGDINLHTVGFMRTAKPLSSQ